MGVIKCYITDLIDLSLKKKKTGSRDDRRNVAWKGRERGKNVKNLCENGEEEAEKETEEEEEETK